MREHCGSFCKSPVSYITCIDTYVQKAKAITVTHDQVIKAVWMWESEKCHNLYANCNFATLISSQALKSQK